MIQTATPGIYILEKASGPRPIQPVGMSTAGFVGRAPKSDAPVNEAVAINGWRQFVNIFVGDSKESTHLSRAVHGFFDNRGSRCWVVNIGDAKSLTGGSTRAGLDLLEEVEEVAIVAAPGFTDATHYDALLSHCEKIPYRIACLDGPPPGEINQAKLTVQLTSVKEAPAKPSRKRSGGDGDGDAPAAATPSGGLRPRASDNGFGAFYFPWLRTQDPITKELMETPPSGHMAGIWARTDATRGIHKAPANEIVTGAVALSYNLTDQEQAVLNPAGVNCIRSFSRSGIRVWGARTVAEGASEWRYLSVRRLFSMIEESIRRSMRWVVFEPNDERLWSAIVRDVSAFLRIMWRGGSLKGTTPEEAFFVKCDAETNPPEVIDAGQVVTEIGIAPVKPAEFIVFQIGQFEGGSTVEVESNE